VPKNLALARDDRRRGHLAGRVVWKKDGTGGTRIRLPLGTLADVLAYCVNERHVDRWLR
jgi:hypothetical protein